MRFQTKWEQGRYEINVNRLYPPNTPENLAKWCNGTVCSDGPGTYKWVEVYNRDGLVKIEYGDWLCKGINDNFFNVPNEVIEKNYELLPMSQEDLKQNWE